ncbi:MAG: D-cysteine desulfhydrase [Myxococcota bacterium]|nr:D-cysteine desulfhydrase [Myxococcota bacterium]
MSNPASLLQPVAALAPHPLLDAFPAVAGHFPLVRIGEYPTPVRLLSRLGAAYGLDQLWLKNDGLSGRPYGGNKVRKLEFLLGAAMARGAREWIAAAALGSHHVFASALYGAKVGIRTHAILFPQPVTDHVRMMFAATRQHAASVMVIPHPVLSPLASGWKWFARAITAGRPPFVLPMGGSGSLSSLGYVGAAFELKRQIERGELPEPRAIFTAVGSCGTMAGLLAGARLAGLNSRVVGIGVVERIIANPARVAAQANQCLRLLEQAGAIPRQPLFHVSDALVLPGYLGVRYGDPTPLAMEIVEQARKLEDLPLETTYTGKALAGALDYARQQGWRSEPLLFWNTCNSYTE